MENYRVRLTVLMSLDACLEAWKGMKFGNGDCALKNSLYCRSKMKAVKQTVE